MSCSKKLDILSENKIDDHVVVGSVGAAARKELISANLYRKRK